MGSPIVKEPKILFFFNHSSTFIDNDIVIFRGFSHVVSYECKIKKGLVGFIVSMVRELFFIIRNISGSALIYCWFADYHALIPALIATATRKPLYLVLGGYDVSFVPELNYGSFSNRFRGFCARYALKKAKCNLPVSENLAKEAIRRAGEISVHVLPTGYDPERIIMTGHLKENMIVTAALVHEMQTFMVKGIDRFLELAKLTPEMDFVIIGMGKELLSNFASKPDNLKIIPPVSQSELYGWFGKAKYYAQFSRSEGMPNALCEAMLMECIPVGTSIGGIPAVIQDGGMILDQWDPVSAKSFLLEHLDDEILRKKARESIISRFHLEKRAQYLKELLTSA